MKTGLVNLKKILPENKDDLLYLLLAGVPTVIVLVQLDYKRFQVNIFNYIYGYC
jgi:hypothetical protein